MSTQISKVLSKFSDNSGLKFTYKSAPLTNAEVFSETGLLPALARRADQLSQLCFGYGIGIKVEKAEGTKLGKKVTFDDVTPETLRSLCFIDVILEMQKTSTIADAISLDELQYEM